MTFVANLTQITSLQAADYFYILQKSATEGLPDLDCQTTVALFFAAVPVPAAFTSDLSVDGNLTISNVRPMTVQIISANTGTVAVDLSQGEYVILNLDGDVNTLNVVNWPAYVIAKCILEVRNSGSFGIYDWADARWPFGIRPVVTSGPGAIDIYSLHSADQGNTVIGSVIGQNYS